MPVKVNFVAVSFAVDKKTIFDIETVSGERWLMG